MTPTQLIARVLSISGQLPTHLNESELAAQLEHVLQHLKTSDEKRYLEIISELTDHIEILATELGHLQNKFSHLQSQIT